jgi:ABC-type multidrug transport system fused ATPase/permease subunit
LNTYPGRVLERTGICHTRLKSIDHKLLDNSFMILRLDPRSRYNVVYGAVAMGAILLMVVRQLLRAYVSVRASRTLHRCALLHRSPQTHPCIAAQIQVVLSNLGGHRNMLDAIMKTRMSFFETTPHGRVINRFSNDMTTVDEQLANSLGATRPTATRPGAVVLICGTCPMAASQAKRVSASSTSSSR